MSRWGELIPHRDGDGCLCGCRDDPPVQCWHTEPGSPCDWNVCRQPERAAAGDRGTDPARGGVAVDPRDLIPLYTDDTSIRIRCIGGPEDGQTRAWDAPGGQPPPRVLLPVDTGPLSLADLEPTALLPVAVYDLRLDDCGFPSRDDAGVCRYEYRGMW